MCRLLFTWLGNSQELRNCTAGHLAVTEGTHRQHCVIGPCVRHADMVCWFVFSEASAHPGGQQPSSGGLGRDQASH